VDLKWRLAPRPSIGSFIVGRVVAPAAAPAAPVAPVIPLAPATAPATETPAPKK
jgi:hypothetical protein